MKKQITVQSAPVFAGLKKSVTKYAEKYAKFLSSIIEMEISAPNAVRITHSIVAFIFLLLSASGNIFFFLICFVWFVVTLLDCRKGGLK